MAGRSSPSRCSPSALSLRADGWRCSSRSGRNQRRPRLDRSSMRERHRSWPPGRRRRKKPDGSGRPGPRPNRPVVKRGESSAPAATDRNAAVPSAAATHQPGDATDATDDKAPSGINDAATAATPIVTDRADARPGRAAAAVPSGTVNINAVPWASVYIDGKPVGDTPLAQIAVSAGTHEVIFKRPDSGSAR